MKKIRNFPATAIKNSLQVKTYESLCCLLVELHHSYTDRKSLEQSLRDHACYVAQTFNFFMVSPMDSESIAHDRLRAFSLGKRRSDDIFHKEAFKAADMLAAVSMMFKKIRDFSFNFPHLSDHEFTETLAKELKEMKEQFLQILPEVSDPISLFMDRFLALYFCPWNRDRWSNYQSRANFTTGIDFIH